MGREVDASRGVAVVTGGSAGLGRAIVRELSGRGWDVAILARGEEGRRESNQAVLSLTEKIATLSDAMRANQQLMLKIAEGQQSLAPVLQRLAQG
ncbi:MAG: SDR family NAD(P)-dependent oxidoreductase, partial [Microbacterium sp.]|nr:SDR family NAD(P)-dependent oxidoreductase [Microbacterium sp.]